MDYNCEICEQPAQRVASIRTRTAVENLPKVLGQIYNSVMQYLNEANEIPSGVPFVSYYNMDMQDLNIEAGFPISKELQENDNVKMSEIPAGKQLTCIYKGPYGKIESAYNALMQYIKDNKYDTTGVCYEFYLNDPENTPPEELLTRVSYILK